MGRHLTIVSATLLRKSGPIHSWGELQVSTSHLEQKLDLSSLQEHSAPTCHSAPRHQQIPEESEVQNLELSSRTMRGIRTEPPARMSKQERFGSFTVHIVPYRTGPRGRSPPGGSSTVTVIGLYRPHKSLGAQPARTWSHHLAVGPGGQLDFEL